MRNSLALHTCTEGHLSEFFSSSILKNKSRPKQFDWLSLTSCASRCFLILLFGWYWQNRTSQLASWPLSLSWTLTIFSGAQPVWSLRCSFIAILAECIVCPLDTVWADQKCVPLRIALKFIWLYLLLASFKASSEPVTTSSTSMSTLSKNSAIHTLAELTWKSLARKMFILLSEDLFGTCSENASRLPFERKEVLLWQCAIKFSFSIPRQYGLPTESIISCRLNAKDTS